MSVNILSLRNFRGISALVFFALLFTLAVSLIAKASPGAHGPNGEHLDSKKIVLTASNPKFETFTESFELLGELLDNKLVIYLHDFKSNRPVKNASVEVESGEVTAIANYSDELGVYTLTEQAMINLLSQPGAHDIVLTIMTEDNGDLLIANLSNSKTESEAVHEEHEHHFPWWIVFLCVGVFFGGFLVGNLAKTKTKTKTKAKEYK
jgi:hypothetical protein